MKATITIVFSERGNQSGMISSDIAEEFLTGAGLEYIRSENDTFHIIDIPDGSPFRDQMEREGFILTHLQATDNIRLMILMGRGEVREFLDISAKNAGNPCKNLFEFEDFITKFLDSDIKLAYPILNSFRNWLSDTHGVSMIFGTPDDLSLPDGISNIEDVVGKPISNINNTSWIMDSKITKL